MPSEARPTEPKRNHLISRKKFYKFVADHPGTERDLESLLHWCKITEKAVWMNFGDVRSSFPHADLIDDMICFNVGGNKYRVVVKVQYRMNTGAKVFVKLVMTHKEYDSWK